MNANTNDWTTELEDLRSHRLRNPHGIGISSPSHVHDQQRIEY